MNMAGCQHKYVYGGLLNVFDGKSFVKLFEYWRCSKCGITRVGARSMDTTSSTQGLFPEPKSPEERWLLIICNLKKDVELVLARLGEEVLHQCTAGEVKLNVDSVVRERGSDGKEDWKHMVIPLEDIATGYIDLSTTPARIVRTGARR